MHVLELLYRFAVRRAVDLLGEGLETICLREAPCAEEGDKVPDAATNLETEGGAQEDEVRPDKSCLFADGSQKSKQSNDRRDCVDATRHVDGYLQILWDAIP